MHSQTQSLYDHFPRPSHSQTLYDQFPPSTVVYAEACIWGPIFLVWIFLHVRAAYRFWKKPGSMFPRWGEALAKDDLTNLQEKEFVQTSNQRVFACTRAGLPGREEIRIGGSPGLGPKPSVQKSTGKVGGGS